MNYAKLKYQLEWIPPALEGYAELADVKSAKLTDLKGAVTPNRAMEFLKQLGCFRAAGAETPREELSLLLEVAAEVEHALLLQYLYAAYSIDPDASGESADTQRKIINVAVQEMAHLITIQNLILAINGPAAFHIGRETVRAGNPFNPLPFLLEPVSEIALAEYVLAEMPASLPPEKSALAQLIEQLKQEVLAKTGLAPHRVGALYAKIYWILQPTDAPYGPIALQPDPAISFTPGWHLQPGDFAAAQTILEHEATPDEWHASFGPDMRIHQIHDAQTAVAAIASVMTQGEGIGHAEDSHFYEFLETLDLLKTGAVSVLPLAKNPYVGHLPPGVAQGSPLKHPYVRLWANLCNVRYSALLLHIGHALTLKTSEVDRAVLVEAAFSNMRPWVLRLMTQLASPEMRALDAHSAATFELLREQLPTTPRKRWQLQRDFIEIEQAVSAALYARPELVADIAGKQLLDDLTVDRDAWRQLVDSRLQA